MQFSYINFLPFMDELRKNDLEVSYTLLTNNISRNRIHQIASVLHHKDYKFPSSWIENPGISLKGTSASHVKNFMETIADKEINTSKITLLDKSEHHFYFDSLSNMMKIPLISIIHDQILTPQFIEKIENKIFELYLKNPDKNIPIHSISFDYPIQKFNLENMDTMSTQTLQENFYYIYNEVFNRSLDKLWQHNMCPLDIMPLHYKVLPKIIETTGSWLDKNFDDYSLKKTMDFFNNSEYKHPFSVFLRNPEHRNSLENFIFAINKNENETLKNSIYQNFPFLKFDMPIYTSSIKKNSLNLNISSILKDSKKNNIFSEETILKNLQKMVNYSSKFYGLQPFKIKKVQNGIFNLETNNSNIETNEKVAEFLNVLLYEVFSIAKHVDFDLPKTLDQVIPVVHSQVLTVQIPENEVKAIPKINKF